MNRIGQLLFIILIFSPLFSFDNETNNKVDRDEIIDLTNNYILLLQKTINQGLGEFLAEMNKCFDDPIVNDHTYDLSDNLDYTFIASYLLDAKDDESLVEFDASTEDIEILDCTYFDAKTSNQYTFVKLPKVMIRKGNKTSNYVHYLSINISEKPYLIEAVYQDEAKTHQKYIAPCMKETLNVKKQRELANKIESKFEDVTQLYASTKYLEALVIIEEILDLNPQHQASLDAKEAVFDLITPNIINKNIAQSLKLKKLSTARKTLTLAQIYAIGTPEQLNQWNTIIKTEEKKIKQEFDFREAENFYSNQMYQQALPIYLSLQKQDFNNKLLQSRIKICRESDPLFVQKKLKEAYNIAVKSKGKRADETFKTYYKYENSGYLNGDNFKFMCQMMLSRGNKGLLKEMNISPNQSKNLAVSYFYKAKNLGANMDQIEMTVFTKNFDKKRKK